MEIEFHGKAVNGGEWAHGYYVKTTEAITDRPVSLIIPFGGRMDPDGGFPAVEVDPETVGQYTGLSDRMGTRIFEGDILKHISGRICKVVYVAKTNISAFDLIPIAGFDCPPPAKWDLWSGAEVIGNIHDNPERGEWRNDE